MRTTRWDPWGSRTESPSMSRPQSATGEPSCAADRLKQVMQEIDSSFDEKNLGMSKFSGFVPGCAHSAACCVRQSLENGPARS